MLLIFDVGVKQQSHLFEVVNWAPKKGQGGNYNFSALCDRLGEAGPFERK